MADALRSALYSIPAEDRETWVQVGMAIHAGLGEAGFELWDAWSRQAESYRATDARAVWRGFKREGGITVATLYHLAREHGWQGEAPVLPEPSPEEKRRRQEQARREAQEREREAQRAARDATRMLGEAELLPHPYLATKGFPEANGLVIARDNLLLVPMRDRVTGEVTGVQKITPDGAKRFLKGCQAKGSVFNLGLHWTRWFVEGYATGLSVQAALRRMYREDQVVVCFSAANLSHVAAASPGAPRPKYVIADHDESGTGEKYARKTGLPYWMPPEVGDANDFHQAEGLYALADALREVLNGRRDAARPSDV